MNINITEFTFEGYKRKLDEFIQTQEFGELYSINLFLHYLLQPKNRVNVEFNFINTVKHPEKFIKYLRNRYPEFNAQEALKNTIELKKKQELAKQAKDFERRYKGITVYFNTYLHRGVLRETPNMLYTGRLVSRDKKNGYVIIKHVAENNVTYRFTVPFGEIYFELPEGYQEKFVTTNTFVKNL